MEWDIFISHASEDKEKFVLPFTDILTSYGVKVWLDKFSLKIGDSLSHSIDEGLSNSKFGLVILSKPFFNKGWTDYELRSLLSREVGYQKVILPIWHDISKEDVIKFSPYLADKFALKTSDTDINDIALRIIELIRPDIYENYYRSVVYQNLREEDHIKVKVPNISINFNRPFRYDTLSLQVLLQIKVIQRLFYDVFPVSFEQTIKDFRKDTNPEREVLVWHRIAATYLEFIANKKVSKKQKKEIFGAILKISMSHLRFDKNDFKSFYYVTVEHAKQLFVLYNSIVPNISSFDSEIYGTIQ